MNKTNIPEPDLDNVLKRALKDDLPPEAEARMQRHFLSLRRTLDRPQSPVEEDEWPWMHGFFQRDFLAAASAIMLILGIVIHFSAPPSALAHSIGQLKMIVTVSMSLNRAASMECTVLKPGAGGKDASYRVLWRTPRDARLDMFSADGTQTIWISNETISFADSDGGAIRSMPIRVIAPGSVWQPAVEFMTPELLAKQMEAQYRLMQTGESREAGMDEFLIVGKEDGHVVEIAFDTRTYLPKVLKKYAPDPDRMNGSRVCLLEAVFRWNQPIPGELFVPGPSAAKQ